MKTETERIEISLEEAIAFAEQISIMPIGESSACSVFKHRGRSFTCTGTTFQGYYRALQVYEVEPAPKGTPLNNKSDLGTPPNYNRGYTGMVLRVLNESRLVHVVSERIEMIVNLEKVPDGGRQPALFEVF